LGLLVASKDFPRVGHAGDIVDLIGERALAPGTLLHPDADLGNDVAERARVDLPPLGTDAGCRIHLDPLAILVAEHWFRSALVVSALVPRPLPEGDAAMEARTDCLLLAEGGTGRQIGADALRVGALAPA
jgi:hypothetical protein